MSRTLAGKFDHDSFYGWLNPDLPREKRYARDRLLSDYVEVGADTYDHFLEILPPMHFSSSGFAIIEAKTDDIRLAFFRVDGRFFAANISDTDQANGMAAVRSDIAAQVRP
jgi:hypothetical protein